MSGTDHLFRAVSRTQTTPDGTSTLKGHSITCTVAGRQDELFIPASGIRGPGGLPTDVVLKKATQAGWLVRRKGRSRTCPKCQTPTPKPQPPLAASLAELRAVAASPVFALSQLDQKRMREAGEAMADAGRRAADAMRRTRLHMAAACPAASRALEGLPAPDRLAEVYVPAPDHPHPTLEHGVVHVSPPTPEQDEPPMDTPTTTPALRRAINAQLHEVHAGESGYLADWTDAKVAKALDCSPAAVAAIREDLFGPETNEADRRAAAARDTELAALRQMLKAGKAKVDEAMETLAAADRLYSEANGRLAALERN